jgi:hypothetical protein
MVWYGKSGGKGMYVFHVDLIDSFIHPLSNHLPTKQGHLIVAYNNRSKQNTI